MTPAVVIPLSVVGTDWCPGGRFGCVLPRWRWLNWTRMKGGGIGGFEWWIPLGGCVGPMCGRGRRMACACCRMAGSHTGGMTAVRVVLVPDLGEGLDRYDSVIAALVAAGADVTGLDRTDTVVVDFEPVVDELAALVDRDDRLPVVWMVQA